MSKSINYSVTVYSAQKSMNWYTISVCEEEDYIETLKEALSKNEIIELPQSDGKTTILFNTKNVAMVEIVKTSENEE